MPSLVDWRAAVLVRGDMMLNDMSLTGGGEPDERRAGNTSRICFSQAQQSVMPSHSTPYLASTSVVWFHTDSVAASCNSVTFPSSAF